MAMNQVHPNYSQFSDVWQFMRDSFLGERAIKKRGATYLPYTQGQIADGADKNPESAGGKAHNAYVMRAVYPEILTDAVEAAVGILNKHPPTIELPAALEPMRENATLLGESLEQLLQNIHAEQLTPGRVGLLGDIRADGSGNVRPVIVTYKTETAINWDDVAVEDDVVKLKFVVLDESDYEMSADFTWHYKEKYLALGLVRDNVIDADGVYSVARLTGSQSLAGAEWEPPSVRGTTLTTIPFVFINSNDINPLPDKPPLEGLANIALGIYRVEADYRQALFLQGQDTLVRIGYSTDPNQDDDVRVGAGSHIDVPEGGDAKFIGVSSQGLPEMRQAIENDHQRAAEKSAKFISNSEGGAESGEALKIRVSAQTVTLPQIARAAAKGLENVLKTMAIWVGANPDEVVVTPNLKFTDDTIDSKTLLDLIQAKALGAVISDQSIHDYIVKQGFTKRTLEEEQVLIANEVSATLAQADPAAGGADGQ